MAIAVPIEEIDFSSRHFARPIPSHSSGANDCGTHIREIIQVIEYDQGEPHCYIKGKKIWFFAPRRYNSTWFTLPPNNPFPWLEG